MRFDRRQVLKAAGAAGVGSLGVVGTVASAAECSETLDTVERSEGTETLTGVTSPAAAGNSTGGLPFATDPFEVDAGAFEAADPPANRITGEMTWNPTGEDPTKVELYLERQNFGGEWEIVGKDADEPLVAGGDPLTENRLELAAVDGDTFEGTDTTGEEVTNPVIVTGGETFRFVVRVYDGVADFDIQGEVQAFDPDCEG